MEFKKQIEEVLETLKAAGFDRSRIEEDMGYSANYIDQTLSKGGNKKFLKAMTIYRMAMLQNATPTAGDSSVSQRLIEQIEARRQDAEALAQKMEQHYEDVKAEKKDLYGMLHSFQKSLDLNLNVIQQNLGENKSYLELLVKVIRTNDAEIMAGLDSLENQPAGTHRIRAGKKELAAGKALKDSHKKVGSHK